VSFDLRSIARALGGEVSGRQVLAPGPGHSPRDRSLAIYVSNDAPDGFLVHSHAGDDWHACRAHVRSRLGLPAWQPGDGREQQRTIKPQYIDKWDFDMIDQEVEQARRTEDDLGRIDRAQGLWREAGDPRGTLVEDYLRSRALALPDHLAGEVLRFHPRTPWRNENTGRTEFIPCLVAAFRSLDDNIVTAIHRIRVDQPARWPKTDRRMLGVVHRSAIQLGAASGKLAIGEGLETCLAAMELGVEQTAWALGSVGAISFFPVIDGVAELMILGEIGAASDRAIKICGRRWRRASRRVFVSRPKHGSDHNDILMQRRVS
jgi:putative DNA primase/helicase